LNKLGYGNEIDVASLGQFDANQITEFTCTKYCLTEWIQTKQKKEKQLITPWSTEVNTKTERPLKCVSYIYIYIYIYVHAIIPECLYKYTKFVK
jgi:hypothetical protein